MVNGADVALTVCAGLIAAMTVSVALLVVSVPAAGPEAPVLETMHEPSCTEDAAVPKISPMMLDNPLTEVFMVTMTEFPLTPEKGTMGLAIQNCRLSPLACSAVQAAE